MGLTRDLTAYASAARTATPTAFEFSPRNAKALTVFIDATAVTATPSVVCTIDGKDPLSGKYFNMLTSAAIATVSTKTMRIGPGLAAVANLTIADFLPSAMRIVMTHGDADSITYSVSVMLGS
jgi:hypothetical protein